MNGLALSDSRQSDPQFQGEISQGQELHNVTVFSMLKG